MRPRTGIAAFATLMTTAGVLAAAAAGATAAHASTAAHDNGLVIEAFSVPPDLAARGLLIRPTRAQAALTISPSRMSVQFTASTPSSRRQTTVTRAKPIRAPAAIPSADRNRR